MQICSESFTFEAAMIDDSFVFLVVVATVVTFEAIFFFFKANKIQTNNGLQLQTCSFSCDMTTTVDEALKTNYYFSKLALCCDSYSFAATESGKQVCSVTNLNSSKLNMHFAARVLLLQLQNRRHFGSDRLDSTLQLKY